MRTWLPACPRRIVPWPSLMSADSNLKISRRNLFWEEWTRVRISVLSTSRFFSKKPVGSRAPTRRLSCTVSPREGRAGGLAQGLRHLHPASSRVRPAGGLHPAPSQVTWTGDPTPQRHPIQAPGPAAGLCLHSGGRPALDHTSRRGPSLSPQLDPAPAPQGTSSSSLPLPWHPSPGLGLACPGPTCRLGRSFLPTQAAAPARVPSPAPAPPRPVRAVALRAHNPGQTVSQALCAAGDALRPCHPSPSLGFPGPGLGPHGPEQVHCPHLSPSPHTCCAVRTLRSRPHGQA